MLRLVHHGDCRALLTSMPDCSLDACVTDPPYEIGFMSRGWDGRGIAFDVALWREVWRVLKPGAHLVAFGGSRTVHRLTCAIEDAGFEIRDQGVWVSAQCFPKSLDVSKSIDAAAGAEREVVGTKNGLPGYSLAPSKGQHVYGRGIGGSGDPALECAVTGPATPEAAQWSGYGTALKTMEPWVLARKPLSERTVARNVLRWGTGALNIDGCRLPWANDSDFDDTAERVAGMSSPTNSRSVGAAMVANAHAGGGRVVASGRWPSAVVVADLDADSIAEGIVAIGEGLTAGNAPRQLARGGLGYESTARGTTAPIGGDGADALSGILGPYTRHFRIPGTDGTHDEAWDDECAALATLIANPLPSLIVCAKASTAEREEGLDRVDWLTVEVLRKDGDKWVSEGRRVQLLVDTDRWAIEATGASGIPSSDECEWSTYLFGRPQTGQSQKASRFIIETKTRSTTDSKTLSRLLRSGTNESTADASGETGSSGSRAASAGSSGPSITITNVATVSLPGVGRVASKTRLRISALVPSFVDPSREEDGAGRQSPRAGAGRRSKRICTHPTVKPVALMRHLVRLVTPPGGTVLDPFAGSGSTGVAATWESRGFVGCEINDTEREPYVRIARARLAYAERVPAPELRCRAPKAEPVDERQVPLFAEVG